MDRDKLSCSAEDRKLTVTGWTCFHQLICNQLSDSGIGGHYKTITLYWYKLHIIKIITIPIIWNIYFGLLSFAALRHTNWKKKPSSPDVGSKVKVHTAIWWNKTHITLLVQTWLPTWRIINTVCACVFELQPTVTMVKQMSQTQSLNVDKVMMSRETGIRVAAPLKVSVWFCLLTNNWSTSKHENMKLSWECSRQELENALEVNKRRLSARSVKSDSHKIKHLKWC